MANSQELHGTLTRSDSFPRGCRSAWRVGALPPANESVSTSAAPAWPAWPSPRSFHFHPGSSPSPRMRALRPLPRPGHVARRSPAGEGSAGLCWALRAGWQSPSAPPASEAPASEAQRGPRRPRDCYTWAPTACSRCVTSQRRRSGSSACIAVSRAECIHVSRAECILVSHAECIRVARLACTHVSRTADTAFRATRSCARPLEEGIQSRVHRAPRLF